MVSPGCGGGSRRLRGAEGRGPRRPSIRAGGSPVTRCSVRPWVGEAKPGASAPS